MNRSLKKEQLRSYLLSKAIDSDSVDLGLRLGELIFLVDEALFKHPRMRVLHYDQYVAGQLKVASFRPYFQLDDEKHGQDTVFIYVPTLKMNIKKMIDEIQYIDRENRLLPMTNEKMLYAIACHEVRHRVQWHFFQKLKQFTTDYCGLSRCSTETECVKLAIALYEYRKWSPSDSEEFDAYVIMFLAIHQLQESDSTPQKIREFFWPPSLISLIGNKLKSQRSLFLAFCFTTVLLLC